MAREVGKGGGNPRHWVCKVLTQPVEDFCPFGAVLLAQPAIEDRESPTAAHTRSDFGGECQPPPFLPTCGDSRGTEATLTALLECVNTRLCVCSRGGCV